MQSHRVLFAELPWESPMPGIRHKVLQDGTHKLRLVEYTPEVAPHWCDRGHHGYILEGRFEIEFDDETQVFEPGDGVFIPHGPKHRHRATALTARVLAIFVERA
jgi:ethanolamine utilization protein EutQ (cupin superfamily)